MNELYDTSLSGQNTGRPLKSCWGITAWAIATTLGAAMIVSLLSGGDVAATVASLPVTN